MSVWRELGRFLERATPLLEEAVRSLQETRELLSGLKPTVDALPVLVRETHGLVVDVRALVRELSPLLIDTVGSRRD